MFEPKNQLNLALYYNELDKNEISKAKLQLHLNFWNVNGKKFIDIGVMYKKNNHNNLCIYINTDLQKNDIEDITKKLESEEIRDLIFNEHLTISSCEMKKANFFLTEREIEYKYIRSQESSHILTANDIKPGAYIVEFLIEEEE